MTKTMRLLIVSAILINGCASTPVEELPPEINAEPTPDAQTSPETQIEENAIVKPPELDLKAEDKQYEKLIYGQKKDLVCTTPILAKGKLKDRPNLQVMWENYLYNRPEGIWGEIGGKVEVNGNLPMDQGRWTNACAVRLSHMLNKSGHKIPRDDSNKTVSGGNGDQYYYRLNDFQSYMIATYGEPAIDIRDGTANSFDLPITPGIVLMDFPNNSFTGHVTIWNGAGTVDGSEIGGYQVQFWHLPCFIPESRETAVTNGNITSPEPASP